MDILRKKDLKLDFSNDIVDIIQLMELGDSINLVGSMNLKSMIYANDYDCYEQIQTKNLSLIYRKWKLNMGELLQKKDVYIGDIKCGVDKNKQALRWKVKDIYEGYVLSNGQRYNILDCMASGEMWKMDIIALINNVFKDFSCVYELYSEKNLKQIMKTRLMADVKELYKNGKYFKCMKRIFSIGKLEHDNKIMTYIYPYLTGDLGIISNVLSDIGTVQYLLENVQFLDTKHINYEIENFKNRLSNVYKTDAFLKKQKQIVDLINKIEKDNYKLDDINKLSKELDTILSTKSKTIINNSIFKKYIK